MNQEAIRNFCIISHIDHGKTTLTDRFLEKTRTVAQRDMHERFLDSHPISQERGVTIKLAPVRMKYNLSSEYKEILGCDFLIFNLIDTPGHADFSYEVSRSLAACEGAVLLVDATVGIQAQTLANAQVALQYNLKLIPVINKIDLPNADIGKTAQQLIDTFDFRREEIILISAKTGEGVDRLLEEIAFRLPSPKGNEESAPRCLIFSSIYDVHKGVIAYIRVVDGSLEKHRKIKFMASEKIVEPLDIGFFLPNMQSQQKLETGEVGWVATGLKDVSLCRVGDTITSENHDKLIPLPGYQEARPMVFTDFYPENNEDYELLIESVKKLKLNDASLFFNQIHSPLFGQGLRMGFLGLFHAEIVQERLERDFNVSVIATTPSVEYKIVLRDGKEKVIYSAQECPPLYQLEKILEPYVEVSIFTPLDYMGVILQLCQNYRATFVTQRVFGLQTQLVYKMPLMELISGFYDKLKSISSGFASLDWKPIDFQQLNAVLVEILINKQKVSPLSFILPRQNAYQKAREMVARLKKAIPRQLFEVVIQASINSKIIARERIAPFRKDVTAKLYGGDQTRKDKLLKKQKKGKKRMKAIGKVNIPQEAFMVVFKD